MSASSPGRWRTFAALRDLRFRWLLVGLVCSFLSLTMQNLTRGYLAYQLTGSSAAIGLVLVAWGIPMLGLGLVAGVVADRVPKRNVLLATQSTLGLSALLTALLVHGGAIQFWHLVLIGVVQGVAFGFNVPTRQAIVPEVVPKERLANAVALVNAASSLASIAGAPLAGVIIAIPALGVAGSLYLSAALYLVVLLMYSHLPAHWPTSRFRSSIVGDLLSGFRYVARSSRLPLLLVMGYVPWVAAQPYQQVLPAFAAGALETGSEGLGLLMGATGVGALVGSLVVATVATSANKSRIQLGAGLLFGVALLLFGLSPWFWVSFALLFITGGAANAYMSLNQTLIAEHTAPDYFGRVLSVSSLFSAVGPIAVLPYGWLMDVIGMRQTVAGSGMVVLLFLLAVSAIHPDLRRHERGALSSTERTPRPAELRR
ncbi:MAG: MFS transporter [Chloroflexota bacterium]|nr:MFS transporter [Dehalococcoidia bacterium]MDW8254162.1 MFS transporter [Chloroflexota bacterium]